MTNRETKLAETEVLFREVNEGIAAAAGRFQADEAEFVCECSDPSCAHRIEAPLDEYEGVRGRSNLFLLVPGHEAAEIERVVRHRNGYAVVEKTGEKVRRIVERFDPRDSEPRQARIE
jgi:hypothetical protein